MKTEEQIRRELAEMWSAIHDIPANDPGREAAFQQAAEAEGQMWRQYHLEQAFIAKIDGDKIPVSKLTFTAKTLGPPSGWVEDGGGEEWPEWIEFSFDQIGKQVRVDNVFFYTTGRGVPIACYFDTLAVKMQ